MPIDIHTNTKSVLSYQASFDHYKVKPYPPVCVALCDGTWVL